MDFTRGLGHALLQNRLVVEEPASGALRQGGVIGNSHALVEMPVVAGRTQKAALARQADADRPVILVVREEEAGAFAPGGQFGGAQLLLTEAEQTTQRGGSQGTLLRLIDAPVQNCVPAVGDAPGGHGIENDPLAATQLRTVQGEAEQEPGPEEPSQRQPQRATDSL
jgi:hypothetical protein